MIEDTTRSPEQVVERLDSIIDQVHEIQKPDIYDENACDVLLVSS